MIIITIRLGHNAITFAYNNAITFDLKLCYYNITQLKITLVISQHYKHVLRYNCMGREPNLTTTLASQYTAGHSLSFSITTVWLRPVCKVESCGRIWLTCLKPPNIAWRMWLRHNHNAPHFMRKLYDYFVYDWNLHFHLFYLIAVRLSSNHFTWSSWIRLCMCKVNVTYLHVAMHF